jgi:acyl-CoA thioesterase FadM
MFVVRSCNIRYLKSANFEDELEINTSIVNKTPVRLNLIQKVKRKAELLVVAEVELAVIDSKGSVKKLPINLLEKI